MEELKGWDTQDVERVISVIAPDGIYQDMTQPPAHGHDEIREFGRKWVSGSPDFRVHVDQFVIQGDTVVNRGVISGTVQNEFWVCPRQVSGSTCRTVRWRRSRTEGLFAYGTSLTLPQWPIRWVGRRSRPTNEARPAAHPPIHFPYECGRTGGRRKRRKAIDGRCTRETIEEKHR